MSGTYADVPGQQFPYDRDGTVVKNIGNSNNILATLTLPEKRLINDETTEANPISIGQDSGDCPIAFIFPELRDIAGWYIHCRDNPHGSLVQTSVNTTDGTDGTWVTQSSSWSNGGGDRPYYRSGITSLVVSSIKGIRWFGGVGGLFAHNFTPDLIHIYGAISTGQTQYLAFWNPSSDVAVGGAYFDWADANRGTTATKTCRIKNLYSQTANSIEISTELLTSPTYGTTYTFSTNGTDFYPSINIGSLASGAISSTITMKRNTDEDANTSVWRQRARAAAGSWT